MSKTAEELAHSIATTIWNDFIARPYNAGTPYNFSFKQLKQVIQKEVSNSRQSEIDELTKEVDATFHELEGYKEHNKQLQEEVERLRKERHILLLDFYKGLKNIGRLYSDNTSEEIMMNDVSEFLTTH